MYNDFHFFLSLQNVQRIPFLSLPNDKNKCLVILYLHKKDPKGVLQVNLQLEAVCSKMVLGLPA